MKLPYIVFVLIGCVCGCSSSQDETAAESALRQEIESQSHGNIKLVSFTKTNGQSTDAGGLEVRQIEYTAQIQFDHKGTWLSGGWPGKLVYNFTTEIRKPQTATMSLLNSVDAPVGVSAGSHAQIKGTMVGTKKDNGWEFQTGESILVSPTVSN